MPSMFMMTLPSLPENVQEFLQELCRAVWTSCWMSVCLTIGWVGTAVLLDTLTGAGAHPALTAFVATFVGLYLPRKMRDIFTCTRKGIGYFVFGLFFLLGYLPVRLMATTGYIVTTEAFTQTTFAHSLLTSGLAGAAIATAMSLAFFGGDLLKRACLHLTLMGALLRKPPT